MLCCSINGVYGDVIDKACGGRYAELFVLDQCRQEMERGAVFRNLRWGCCCGCGCLLAVCVLEGDRAGSHAAVHVAVVLHLGGA